MPVRTRFLREVLRHYGEFKAAIASGGSDLITDPMTGETVCFYDLFRGWKTLTRRQKQAVFYWVLCDMKEADAAVAMGYDPSKGTSQVRDYAMSGLKKMAEHHGHY